MSWNASPTWMKTGVVFASIFLAISIVDLVLLCKAGTSMLDPCGMIVTLATLPLFPLTRFFPSGYPCYLGMVVLGTVLYFAVGAGIGWLFSKRKHSS